MLSTLDGGRGLRSHERVTTCTSCGKENVNTLRFCADCGTKLPEPQGEPAPVATHPASKVIPSCPSCGSSNPMGFRFCAACGEPMPKAANPDMLHADLPAHAPVYHRNTPPQAKAATPPEPPAQLQPAPAATHTSPPERHISRSDLMQVQTRSPAPPAAALMSAVESPNTRLQGLPAEGAAPARPSLRLTRLGRDGRELSQNVIYDTFDIGRTEGNLVLPDDPTLSPRHVRILREGAQWSLIDLRSTNGTYLRVRNDSGGESREGVRLVHGTTFWVGHQLLRFEILGRSGLAALRTEDDTLTAGADETDIRARVVLCSRSGLVLDAVYLRGEFVIGRETGQMVFPTDGFLSRRHAVIRQEDGQGIYRLYDLGSSNGTFVRIQGDAELLHRDQIRVGDQVFRAEWSSHPGKESP